MSMNFKGAGKNPAPKVVWEKTRGKTREETRRRPTVRPLGGAEVLVAVRGLWGLSIIIYYIFYYHYSLKELGGMERGGG